MGGGAAGGATGGGTASPLRCNRTGATIGCYCQPSADASSFPFADCSHMPDGMRFCARADALITGFVLPICQCWRQQSQIVSTKMTWMNTPATYSNIRDTPTCP